jgi:hypothetical protein
MTIHASVIDWVKENYSEFILETAFPEVILADLTPFVKGFRAGSRISFSDFLSKFHMHVLAQWTSFPSAKTLVLMLDSVRRNTSKLLCHTARCKGSPLESVDMEADDITFSGNLISDRDWCAQVLYRKLSLYVADHPELAPADSTLIVTGITHADNVYNDSTIRLSQGVASIIMDPLIEAWKEADLRLVQVAKLFEPKHMVIDSLDGDMLTICLLNPIPNLVWQRRTSKGTTLWDMTGLRDSVTYNFINVESFAALVFLMGTDFVDKLPLLNFSRVADAYGYNYDSPIVDDTHFKMDLFSECLLTAYNALYKAHYRSWSTLLDERANLRKYLPSEMELRRKLLLVKFNLLYFKCLHPNILETDATGTPIYGVSLTDETKPASVGNLSLTSKFVWPVVE